MIVNAESKSVITRFCQEWNAFSLFPKLYPAFMMPEALAKKVAEAQTESAPSGAIALPADPHDAHQVMAWAEEQSMSKAIPFETVPIQLVAVDRRRRLALIDVDVSVGDRGYDDGFTRIAPSITMKGGSKRSTWIDPRMLDVYRLRLQGGDDSYRGDTAEERVTLFQKATQSMVRDKINDTQKRMTAAQQRESTQTKIQALINQLKEDGVPAKALADSDQLTIEMDDNSGHLTFITQGLRCTLSSQASDEERKAFTTLILATHR